MSDALTFLKAYKDQEKDDKPLILYGYSLGATQTIGTYLKLLEQEKELTNEVKAMILVSP